MLGSRIRRSTAAVVGAYSLGVSVASILGASAALSVVSLAVPTPRAVAHRPIAALAGAD
jgi:putative lipase involved disintegration of autophagic bodies